MSIKRPIDDLPRAAPRQGTPPAKRPILVNLIADKWWERYVADGNLEYAPAIPELPYRASQAGSRCDRQMYYRMTNEPESDERSVADHWRMWMGKVIGEALAAELVELTDDPLVRWVTEDNIDLRTIGIPGSAHGDVVRYRFDSTDFDDPTTMPTSWDEYDAMAEARHDDPTAPLPVVPEGWWPDLVVELKSAGGYKFKLATTNFNGPPEGPSYGHVLQGAMTAHAIGAPKTMVAWLTVDMLSKKLAAQYSDTELGRFGAEWHYRTADLIDLIDAERFRIKRILKQIELGVLPARTLDDPTEYPSGATVVDWPTGKNARWQVVVNGDIVDTGDTWMCDYCEFKTTCLAAGPGDIVSTPVEEF